MRCVVEGRLLQNPLFDYTPYARSAQRLKTMKKTLSLLAILTLLLLIIAIIGFGFGEPLDLGQVGLHSINVTMLECCEVLRDLCEQVFVLLLLLVNLVLDLGQHVVEVLLADLCKVELFPIRLRVEIKLAFRT